jgi:hypothetical protein
MNQPPMIRFKYPHDCVICGGREESNENMHRIDFNDFSGEQLAKLPGKYLGQYVHKDPKCLGEILKLTGNP